MRCFYLCFVLVVALMLSMTALSLGETPILTEDDEIPELALKIKANETWFYFDISPYKDGEVKWVEVPICSSALVEGENWFMFDSTIENIDNWVMSVDLLFAREDTHPVITTEHSFLRTVDHDAELQESNGAWLARLVLIRGEEEEEIAHDKGESGNSCILGYFVPTQYSFYPVQRFNVSDLDSITEVKVKLCLHVAENLWALQE